MLAVLIWVFTPLRNLRYSHSVNQVMKLNGWKFFLHLSQFLCTNTFFAHNTCGGNAAGFC